MMCDKVLRFVQEACKPKTQAGKALALVLCNS